MDGEELSRRRVLGALGGLGTLASGVAVDNVLLGYEQLGTNLRKQDLAGKFAATATSGLRVTDRNGVRVLLWDDHLRLTDGPEGRVLANHRYPELDAAERRRLDEQHGLDGLLAEGIPTVAALHRGDVTFTFSDPETFFERVRAGEPERAAVELLRGQRPAPPDAVRAIADADPADPEAVATGLIDGFREHTYYDLPRYAAGAVQFNIAFDTVDLRAPFRDDTDFASLRDDDVGMFCNDFAVRTAEALHAVPAGTQSPPVLAGVVIDDRHRHVFTTVASVLSGEDGPVVPATFLDYTHSTLYDDLRLTGLLGEGWEAYNRRHRADTVWWAPVATPDA